MILFPRQNVTFNINFNERSLNSSVTMIFKSLILFSLVALANAGSAKFSSIYLSKNSSLAPNLFPYPSTFKVRLTISPRTDEDTTTKTYCKYFSIVFIILIAVSFSCWTTVRSNHELFYWKILWIWMGWRWWSKCNNEC